jgi:hypothetical protein
MPSEKKRSATAFLKAALAYYKSLGIKVEREQTRSAKEQPVETPHLASMPTLWPLGGHADVLRSQPPTSTAAGSPCVLLSDQTIDIE